jgi:multidrug resistance efflux pump
MAAEAAEVLQEWRRAERLLTVLPVDAPERPDVADHVHQLRALYQRVTAESSTTSESRLAANRLQLERSSAYLDGMEMRYETDGVIGLGEAIPG